MSVGGDCGDTSGGSSSAFSDADVVLAFAGPWVSSIAVRVDHASHGGRWVDGGGGESSGSRLVSDAHVVNADSFPWVSTVAVRVDHTSEQDWW